MSTREAEIAAMQRAIAISALGMGSTSPNPPVGCVILDRDRTPAGEGYHQRKGEAHAETNALAAAGPTATGGTAVVTLEPCNHYGRTPPCHQALLDAGIVSVLIAVLDPTSRGKGGAARLRQAGAEVQIGLLADEALVVLGAWMDALTSGRPAFAGSTRADRTARAPGLRSCFRGPACAPATTPCSTRTAASKRGSPEHTDKAPSLSRTRSRSTTPPGPSMRSTPEACARLCSTVAPNSPNASSKQQLVDGVDVFLPLSDPSARAQPDPPLPPGFEIRTVTRLASSLVLHAERAEPPSTNL
jgi:diaminohydroxyphosphoribosylaminopyrimidine deaminase/5-amino-6-(5-phosphoribosylamino)uracil reductase